MMTTTIRRQRQSPWAEERPPRNRLKVGGELNLKAKTTVNFSFSSMKSGHAFFINLGYPIGTAIPPSGGENDSISGALSVK